MASKCPRQIYSQFTYYITDKITQSKMPTKANSKDADQYLMVEFTWDSPKVKERHFKGLIEVRIEDSITYRLERVQQTYFLYCELNEWTSVLFVLQIEWMKDQTYFLYCKSSYVLFVLQIEWMNGTWENF